ncbi:hypothetical protein [Rhizobium mesoamericanum]|uniref:Uncharacterized protein n=1 Tax=Rhizobium mesoamericanum STM3625 TaxID=1211777 RepID=K0PS30_9HYPH|nr:hypothetical protein [Rhizobium mesoamericanum]CCM79546.1 exported hypothetical protein [Rhizobium mesoamericanum STM3625]
MKFQPNCLGAASFVALLFAHSSLAFGADARRPDEPERLDRSCLAVNEADVNTRKGYNYRELIHQPFLDGKTKEYIEIIFRASNSFERYSGRSTWQEFDLHEVDPYDQRYTSCTAAGIDGNLFHYYANWNKPGYRASAEIWLTPDRKKLSKVIRRYPPDKKEFPFSTVISTFDYNAQAAKRPDDGSIVTRGVLKNDPTCDAVNAAYVKTRRSREYSEVIYEVEKDGSLDALREVRVAKTKQFEKHPLARSWLTYDPDSWTAVDRDGPKFSDCSFGEEAKVGSEATTHYTARWHKYPYVADIDIWVSGEDGRMMKTLRRYDDPDWEFRTQAVIELYNYDPATSVMPPDLNGD